MNPASFAALLLRASLDGALFVLLVGAITRFAIRMPATARCTLWWFASLRLLLGLTGLPALSVPVPAVATHGIVAQARDQAATLVQPIAPAFVPTRSTPPPAAGTVATGVVAFAPSPIGLGRPMTITLTTDPLRALAYGWLAVWLAGVIATLLVHARDARRLGRTWREAAPVESPRVRGWLDAWVGARRARRIELRASREVGAPLIMGGRGARIIVPTTCLDHDASSLRMALAHEVSHVRRGDLGWGLVPALAHSLFWFHPLAHWCVREYALTREEACDAEALRLSEAAPHRYGELLVGFGVDASRPIHAAASCGSSHVHQLTRRLHMLAHASRSSRAQRALAITAMILIGLLSIVPVRFVAADAVDDADDQGTPRSESRSAQSESRRARSTTSSTRAHRASKSVGHGYHYWTNGDEETFSFGYSNGDNQTMCGTWDDKDQRWLQRLKKRASGDYGWFRFDRKTYLVEAEEDIEAIKELMRPEEELGEQQGQLGEEQGRLGERQGELGEKQGELGDEQGELSSRLEEMVARLEESRDDEERDELERKRDELQSRMEDLSDRMAALGREQGKLGERQGALGEKQAALGRRQEAMSRESRAKMRELGQEMIADGRAVLVDG